MLPNDDSAVLDAPATAVVHKPLPHDSARLHVQGAATYIDDIGEPAGTLHIAIGMANKASGKLKSLGLEAVRGAPGVVAVLTAADIPGKNDVAPVFADEPLFAFDEISVPRPGFVRGRRAHARCRRAGRRGSRRSTSRPERRPSRSRMRLSAAREFKTTMRSAAATRRPRSTRPRRRLDGEFSIGGQEHFYLEGQASFAFPGEADEMTVHASTQDPTETQHIVARILGIPDAFVTVETRRMGGGFGGKESQACAWAAIAALAARCDGSTLQSPPRSRRRLRLDRQAPRFPRRLARGLRRRGRGRRLRSRAQRAMRLFRRSFARRRATARCFMPATAIGSLTFRS